MNPGQLVYAIAARDPDLVGLRLRLAGFEIRDSIAAILGGRTWIVWLARWPLDPNVGGIAAHALKFGTAVMDIDSCRVGTDLVGWGGGGSKLHEGGLSRDGGAPRPVAGRWPGNVLLDENAAAILDEMSGQSTSPPVGTTCNTNSQGYGGFRPIVLPNGYGDTGGASRYFPTVNTVDELITWLERLLGK